MEWSAVPRVAGGWQGTPHVSRWSASAPTHVARGWQGVSRITSGAHRRAATGCRGFWVLPRPQETVGPLAYVGVLARLDSAIASSFIAQGSLARVFIWPRKTHCPKTGQSALCPSAPGLNRAAARNTTSGRPSTTCKPNSHHLNRAAPRVLSQSRRECAVGRPKTPLAVRLRSGDGLAPGIAQGSACGAAGIGVLRSYAKRDGRSIR